MSKYTRYIERIENRLGIDLVYNNTKLVYDFNTNNISILGV